jgi:hypothetical protein
MSGKGYEITVGEQTVSLRKLAQMFRVSYPTMRGRWRRGDRGERLVRPSDQKYSRTGRW